MAQTGTPPVSRVGPQPSMPCPPLHPACMFHRLPAQACSLQQRGVPKRRKPIAHSFPYHIPVSKWMTYTGKGPFPASLTSASSVLQADERWRCGRAAGPGSRGSRAWASALPGLAPSPLGRRFVASTAAEFPVSTSLSVAVTFAQYCHHTVGAGKTMLLLKEAGSRETPQGRDEDHQENKERSSWGSENALGGGTWDWLLDSQ